MSPAQWIEAEELYKSGWTQQQVANKYGVRVETVSRHMTKRAVKGGDRAEMVREEIANALLKKQREFGEAKAQRQIDAKEILYRMNSSMLAAFGQEFQRARAAGHGIASLAASAKALKDGLLSLKVAREELYTILGVKPDEEGVGMPSLQVSAMTMEEEETLRNRLEPDDDDDSDPLEEMAKSLSEDVAVEPNG